MLASQTLHSPNTAIMPHITSLGKVIDSDIVQELIRRGAKIRIKNSVFRDEGGFLDSHQPEKIHGIRLILSTPSKGLKPGRILAEVSSQKIDVDGFETIEIFNVKIFGPKRGIFGRERIFEGPVQSWHEATQKLKVLRELSE